MSSSPVNTWPNGARVAVAVTVMFETWSQGAAPSYSVQATSLRPGQTDHAGHAWSTYGGRVGVWRILHALDRWAVPATFFTNAACGNLYPDAVRRIASDGHDIGGHAVYQDQLLAYQEPDEQRATIKRSLDVLEAVAGRRPTGWLSPVLAFTPETVELLAEAGLMWHADVTYADFPHRIDTPRGPIAAVPNSDFTDNRVLKSSPRDLLDTQIDTFDYLWKYEPMSLMVLTLHCQFGGRPMVMSAFDAILAHISRHDGVWFARHQELAEWALAAPNAEHHYLTRHTEPDGQWRASARALSAH
jgi:allantoinase